MKNAITISLILATTALFAQKDQTIFDDVHRVGAWGGPIFEYSNFDSDVQTTGGGGGALVLDDFYLGGYGMGKTEFTASGIALLERVEFKHGGFWFGYTPLQRKVVHPYSSVRLGWGKAKYKSFLVTDPDKLNAELKDNLFVLTPELGLELNIFSFFRIAATASYRYVNGIDDLPRFTNEDLSGFGGTLTLRFGGFGNGWGDFD